MLRSISYSRGCLKAFDGMTEVGLGQALEPLKSLPLHCGVRGAGTIVSWPHQIDLTLLRVVQGLSVGGEYTGSMVFLVEHAPEGRRGLMGALGASGGTVGMLLGSAVGSAFAASMSTAALDTWGWRIPFLLGLVVGVAGYILRRYVLETGVAEKRTRAPIVETLHDYWRMVAGFAGLSVYSAVTFYIGFVYLVSWLQTADGIPPSRSLEINSFSMAMSLPVLITTGWLSDRIGRKPLMLLASMGGVIGALPLFWLLNHPSELLAQIGQLGFVLLTGVYYGSLPARRWQMSMPGKEQRSPISTRQPWRNGAPSPAARHGRTTPPKPRSRLSFSSLRKGSTFPEVASANRVARSAARWRNAGNPGYQGRSKISTPVHRVRETARRRVSHQGVETSALLRVGCLRIRGGRACGHFSNAMLKNPVMLSFSN